MYTLLLWHCYQMVTCFYFLSFQLFGFALFKTNWPTSFQMRLQARFFYLKCFFQYSDVKMWWMLFETLLQVLKVFFQYCSRLTDIFAVVTLCWNNYWSIFKVERRVLNRSPRHEKPSKKCFKLRGLSLKLINPYGKSHRILVTWSKGQTRFQFGVESNVGIYLFCITLLHDSSRELMQSFWPIRCNTKTKHIWGCLWVPIGSLEYFLMFFSHYYHYYYYYVVFFLW